MYLTERIAINGWTPKNYLSAIKHELTCPFELASHSSPICRNGIFPGILVIPRNQMVVQ